MAHPKRKISKQRRDKRRTHSSMVKLHRIKPERNAVLYKGRTALTDITRVDRQKWQRDRTNQRRIQSF